MVRFIFATLIAVSTTLSSTAFADGHASFDWDAALNGDHRSEANKARDQYRHPKETLEFFGLTPTMTVVEVSPGGGWYSEVLAPLLAPHGQLIAGHGTVNGSAYGRRSLGGYLQKLGKNNDLYGSVIVDSMAPPETPLSVADNSVDMALVFRNVHSWLNAGSAEASLAEIARVLKPGGVLGIVQHRGAEGTPLDVSKRTAYVPESLVISMAAAAGLELDGSSEINANAKDTKDYPRGVWTLPPSYREGDNNRDKYTAIGESDRMTLRFKKPGA